MAKFVYIVVFCTAIWAGTLIRAGVKFQIALIPQATIKSATFWAHSAGTVMIPIATLHSPGTGPREKSRHH